MHSDIQILYAKLDKFIKKHYTNLVIRGTLFSITIALGYFLLVTTIEYYNYLNEIYRAIIFYVSVLLVIIVVLRFILYPMFKYFKWIQGISYYKAAKMLQNHFPEVQDNIINAIELDKYQNISSYSFELVIAAINKRIQKMRPIPFLNAVNIKKNLKYLKYPSFFIVIIIILLLFVPEIITEGSKRIINYNVHYEPALPYNITVLNENLNVKKGDNLEIKVRIDGKIIPENLFISYGGNNYILEKQNLRDYNYIFRNINNPIGFKLKTDLYESVEYKVNVLPTPLLIDFRISVSVPEYTGMENKQYNNIGDITIPAGSVVQWNYTATDVDELFIQMGTKQLKTKSVDKNKFHISKRILNSLNYSVSAKNSFLREDNIVSYRIDVIPDLYPDIEVGRVKDTAYPTVFYYKGYISDDYGFNNLYFKYRAKGSDTLKSIKIPITRNPTSQEFFFSYDFSVLKEDNEIEYYFEIFDNDQVNGSKSSRTKSFTYKKPSKQELNQFKEETDSTIQEKLKKSVNIANDVKKEINNLRKKLINSNLSEWERTQIMQSINKKQQQLEELVNEAIRENMQKNDFLNSYDKPSEEMLQKQKEIEELLENIMDEELQRLMDELKELMEEADYKELNKIGEKMDMSYDELSEQLDRNLELLKRYEIEQSIENAIDELKELSDEQNKLSEEVNKKITEDNLKKQQEQHDRLEKLKENYEKALQKNNDLNQPMNLDSFQEQFNKIDSGFNQGSELMNENKRNKSSKNQQQNSEQLNDLAQQMQNMLAMNMSSQAAENLDDLRQIIDNLVKFSFDQEELIEELGKTSVRDPKFTGIMQRQKEQTDNFQIIKDSLNALAKRTTQLSTPIDKEVKNITQNLGEAIESLENRNINRAKVQQQYIMTAANNLSLLLEEVLNSIMNQMMSKGSCSGQSKNKNCNKPGGGKPSLSQMRKQQQSLKQQLQDMINQMKNGKQGRLSKDALNKKLAKMIAQQEIFNKMLNDLQMNNSLAPETMRKLNEIKRLMEENKNDLINRNVTPQTLYRQQQILTRLLEAENSEYQRKVDNERKSKEIKNQKIRNPEEIFQYKGNRNTFDDIIIKSNVRLTKYYKDKYKDYILRISSSNGE